MPIALLYAPSFTRSLKALGSDQIRITALILKALERYYASNCDLSTAKLVAPGFFYKQLRKPYFEAGVESNIRIVLARDGSNGIALVAGNHDDIRTFLKRNSRGFLNGIKLNFTREPDRL